MIPAPITNHVARAIERLTDQYKGRPVIEALLSVFAKRGQEFEDLLWQVISAQLLPPYGTASGVQLDQIGRKVGELREGRSDSDYLVAIRVRARANISKGRSEDLLDVARLAGAAVEFIELAPLGWEMTIFNVSGERWLARILKSAKMICSAGQVIGMGNQSNALIWDDASAPFTFAGQGWSDAQVPGEQLGLLGSVYE